MFFRSWLVCAATGLLVGVQPLFSASLKTGTDQWLILLSYSLPAPETDAELSRQQPDFVILDGDNHPDFALLSSSTIRLAYLSVGEAETYRAYWPRFKDASFLIERNKDWEGDVRVDFRDTRWQKLLRDEEIPRLLSKSYQGFMLDQLDAVPYLEAKNPKTFAGMTEALKHWLAALRAAHPDIVLIANGTEGLPIAAPYVDAYLVEGLFATHDDKGCRKTRRDEQAWKLAQLDKALATAKHPVYVIEYTTPDNLRLGRWAAKQDRKKGFHPYVAVKNLDRLLPR